MIAQDAFRDYAEAIAQAERERKEAAARVKAAYRDAAHEAWVLFSARRQEAVQRLNAALRGGYP